MKKNDHKVYLRNGKECYLDPIRKKLIYVTPEETVRQDMISFLLDTIKVPKDMLIVEQHLSHYGIDSKLRADIVVHAVDKTDENLIVPIAIVECKAPEVYLDEKSINQLLDYCDLLGANYGLLTNGIHSFFYKYDEVSCQYINLTELPLYTDMLSGKFTIREPEEVPPRIPFEKLRSYLEDEFSSKEKDDYGVDISKLTPMNIAVPMFNFLECLLDDSVKMPVGDYGMFELIEDSGIRMLSYGNASGGQFFGPYRSFLIKIGNTTEYYSIGMSTYRTYSRPNDVKTCISVAHDTEKEAHHALQLVVDDNVMVSGDKVYFYHHGRIAVGDKGSGKIDELRMLIRERCPELISGNRFYLGSLTNDRLFRLDDSEVIKLVVNLISYAMIRDEYRDYVKSKTNKSKH